MTEFEIRTAIQLCNRLDNGHCLSVFRRGIQIGTEYRITNLQCADNVVLFAESYEMQIMLNNCSVAARIEFRVNVNKTKADKISLFINSLLVE